MKKLSADEWYKLAEGTYKRGRAIVLNAKTFSGLEQARVCAIVIGEQLTKAAKAGLDARRFSMGLRARGALLDAYWRAHFAMRREEN